MKFLVYIGFLFSSITILGQSYSDSISCSVPFKMEMAYHELMGADSGAMDWFFNGAKPSVDVNLIPWEWDELGPNRTPNEADESKALPRYSLGRGNGTGRINDLYINPINENQVFACSPTGGLFYSENRGKNWKSAGTDALPISGVSSVTVNPENNMNWIISTGDGDDRFLFSAGVYRTFNGGETWEQINGAENFSLPVREDVFNFYISEIQSHPCDFNKQFLATSSGLYKTGNVLSESRKIRWRKVSSERFYDIEINPLDESMVLAGGENLWLSRDCGKGWEKIERPVLPNDSKYGLLRISLEFSVDSAQVVYVCFTRKMGLGGGGVGHGFLYSYNIESNKWRQISSLMKSGNVIPTRARAFEKNPTNDSIILIGNVQPVRISRDYGVTFNSIEKNQMHDDIHDFEFFSDGKTVLAGTDGGVSISLDGGFTWKPWDDGIGAANVHGLSVGQTSELIILYGAYDTGCYLYKEKEWSHVSFGDGFETVIHSEDSSKMLVTMQNGSLYSSENFGDVFGESARYRGFKSSWHTWAHANTGYSNILYHSGSKLARSLDFGKNWEVILDPKEQLPMEGSAWRFYQTDGFPDHLFVVVLGAKRADDRIYFSSNPNDSISQNVVWELLPKNSKNGWVSTILKDASCESCHIITYDSYSMNEKVYYFDGSQYQDISFNLGYSAIRSGVRDKESGRIYLGTKQGLFTKLPNDSSWSLLTGLPGAKIRSLKINYVRGEIYIGTFGRGIWKGKLLK